MFTPEFLIKDRGEFVLVANHSLENAESVQLSIAYNKARIAYGRSHMLPDIQRCRLIYDVRGQMVTEAALTEIQGELSGICNLEFKR